MEKLQFKAQFFRHYCDALQDDKLKRLLRKEGMQGIGLYWSLLELLGVSKSYKVECNYDNIAWGFHTDEFLVKNVVELYDLFEVKDGYFWSKAFTAQMEDLEERYRKRAAAGSKGGKRKAKNKQSDSNATATLKQTRSYKIREDKIDYISPTPNVVAEYNHPTQTSITSSSSSSNDSDDVTTRNFDNRISDEKFIKIVREYMCKATAAPTQAAIHLIDMFAPSWETKDGRSFAGREEEAVGFLKIERDKKYVDKARLSVPECRMVDKFLDILMYGKLYDMQVIDCYRGMIYDAEANELVLVVSDNQVVEVLEKKYLSQFAAGVFHFYPNVKFAYRILQK